MPASMICATSEISAAPSRRRAAGARRTGRTTVGWPLMLRRVAALRAEEAAHDHELDEQSAATSTTSTTIIGTSSVLGRALNFRQP